MKSLLFLNRENVSDVCTCIGSGGGRAPPETRKRASSEARGARFLREVGEVRFSGTEVSPLSRIDGMHWKVRAFFENEECTISRNKSRAFRCKEEARFLEPTKCTNTFRICLESGVGGENACRSFRIEGMYLTVRTLLGLCFPRKQGKFVFWKTTGGRRSGSEEGVCFLRIRKCITRFVVSKEGGPLSGKQGNLRSGIGFCPQ
jgi:hypothetical protein